MYSDIKELLLEGKNDDEILNVLADGNESDRREMLAEISVIRQALENQSAPDAHSADVKKAIKPNKNSVRV